MSDEGNGRDIKRNISSAAFYSTAILACGIERRCQDIRALIRSVCKVSQQRVYSTFSSIFTYSYSSTPLGTFVTWCQCKKKGLLFHCGSKKSKIICVWMFWYGISLPSPPAPICVCSLYAQFLLIPVYSLIIWSRTCKLALLMGWN